MPNRSFIDDPRLVGILVELERNKEVHKATSFCDFPNTCGGCHFWSGAIAVIHDLQTGTCDIVGDTPASRLTALEVQK